jgi:tRNA-dihydrouridine synthase
MNNFWHNLPKPFFILAPMESVTDVVFRHVIASAAKPDIFFTEFVNASSFCSEKGIHSTRGRLGFTPDEQPIVAQIWGNKPEQFSKMAISLAEMGFAGIDINMGCPDKAVVRTGSGSALIRTPELARQLIQAAKASGLPISVKTRIGDVRVDQWHDWIKFLLQQDIVNLSVHLRTRKEMSKVGAHYELIPEIKQLRDEIAPQTLLTINGDVVDRQHGIELAEQYGIDGIMIGRGVFTNPFAFERTPRTHTRDELIQLLNLHLDLFDKYSNTFQGATLETTEKKVAQPSTLSKVEPWKELRRKFDPLKRFFKIYIRDFPGASELRDRLMHCKSTDEVREIIAKSTV